MSDKEVLTDYYIVKEPTEVKWACPFCGEDNKDDYDSFDASGIWYGEETSFCRSCGKEVALNGDADWD